MRRKIDQLLKNDHNSRRKSLRAIVKAWHKIHEGLDEMDRAVLKMCLHNRRHDGR